jgi:hypothetical protein
VTTDLAFGSKAWANYLLKTGIAELRNSRRARDGRITEALYYVRVLRDQGYWWQSRTLEIWVHRFQRGDFEKGVLP